MNSQNSSLTINISNTSKFKSGHVMVNFGRFIFKKMRVSTCSPDKHVACTARYFLATFDKRGKLFSLISTIRMDQSVFSDVAMLTLYDKQT